MSPTVQARVGDTVRANFNLIYKNIEVNKLHDKDDFFDYGFIMRVQRKGPGNGKTIQSQGRTDLGPVRCKNRPPPGEDEAMEVHFLFDELSEFQVDDIWELYFCYLQQKVGPGTVQEFVLPPHPRAHFLGMVQLVG